MVSSPQNSQVQATIRRYSLRNFPGENPYICGYAPRLLLLYYETVLTIPITSHPGISGALP
jgi:hypothetical protein